MQKRLQLPVTPLVALLLLSAMLVRVQRCCAQQKVVPEVRGTLLSGAALHLPEDAKGRPVVLVFGFSRSARDEGKAWATELLKFERERPDFRFYQVAMISRAPGFARGFITRAIRASVPASFYPHTLLLTSGEEQWRSLLNVREDNRAYVAVITSGNELAWQTKGVSAEQFSAVHAYLDGALKRSGPPISNQLQ